MKKASIVWTVACYERCVLSAYSEYWKIFRILRNVLKLQNGDRRFSLFTATPGWCRSEWSTAEWNLANSFKQFQLQNNIIHNPAAKVNKEETAAEVHINTVQHFYPNQCITTTQKQKSKRGDTDTQKIDLSNCFCFLHSTTAQTLH